MATATQVDHVTVLGRFLERLVEATPQDAVELRKRNGERAAYLPAIADSSPWPDTVRETVRVGTLLRTEGSRQRRLRPLGSGPSAP